jgi:hypothetical protein
VDLHNLRVVEAIEYAQAAIRDAEEQGKTMLRLIVGKPMIVSENVDAESLITYRER